MNDNLFNVPNLSEITTEIDIDSMASACSNWNSNIASIDMNTGEFKSAFTALNNNGVGVSCVNSIANSLDQMATLVTSISGYLQSNVNNQVAVDDSLLNQAGEVDDLNSLVPNDQRGLSSGAGYSGGSSKMDSFYGSSTGVNNKDKNLNINTDNTLNTSSLDSTFVNNALTLLSSIAKEKNITLSNLLNDESYYDIVKQSIGQVASSLSISKSTLDGIGMNEIIKKLYAVYNSANVSSLSNEIVYNYLNNIATLNNITTDEVTSQFSNHFVNISRDIDKVINNDSTLIDIYDGNGLEDLNSDSVIFIRGVVDIIAGEQDVTSENLLTNSSYSSYLKETLSEISQVFSSL